MNEIYAIDPQAPEDLKDIKAMLSQFGFENGRFIAAIPTEWINLLNEHVQHLHGFDRQRFIRLLVLHKDALLNVSEDYRITKSWIENLATIKNTSRSINRVLTKNPNPYSFESLHNFLWTNDEVNKSRGAHISMSTEAYRKAIKPLAQHSSEIHMADRYFQLRRKEYGQIDFGRQSVLRELLIEAEKNNRCEVFKIHLKRQDYLKETQIEDDLNEVGTQANLKRLQIEYTLNNDMIHGRYIFSIKGGLQFDQGFEPHLHKKNHVHWLSKAELEPIIKFYS